jgi:hypothetical protein
VLVQGATTTASPTYVNGQTNPISLDTAGNVRVNVVAGGAGGGNVTGGTAHDAVGTAVNPVLTGGYSSTAAPTNVSTDGDAVRAWHMPNGARASQSVFAGIPAVAGAGVNGTGVQRVTIATDDVTPVTLGTTADAATAAGAVGSLSAKLRTATTQLDNLYTLLSTTNSQLPAALGTQAPANAMGVTLPDLATLSGVGTCSAACASTVLLSGETTGYQSIEVQITSVGVGSTPTFQCSSDNTTWSSCAGSVVAPSSASNPAATTSTIASQLKFPVWSRYFRVFLSGYTSGTYTAIGYLRQVPYTSMVATSHIGSTLILGNGQQAESAARNGSPVSTGGRVRTTLPTTLVDGDAADFTQTTSGALVVKEGASTEQDWSYTAAASGIVNTTTAVTIKTAAAAGVRNYVTYCTLSHGTLGGATEFVIRDGAGGTVLYRTQLQTTALVPTTIEFRTPRRGTAATLLEIATLTGVTGGVYVNCGGYEAN